MAQRWEWRLGRVDLPMSASEKEEMVTIFHSFLDLTQSGVGITGKCYFSHKIFCHILLKMK